SADALAVLERYAFPGNVRELRNMLERALVSTSSSEITLDSLPAHVRGASDHRHKMSLAELERAYIAEILDFTRGKKSKAAAILGISRKNLLEKRKRYGLDGGSRGSTRPLLICSSREIEDRLGRQDQGSAHPGADGRIPDAPGALRHH